MESFDWRHFLSQHWLFKVLEPDEVEEVLKDANAREVTFEGGQTILSEGEVGDSLFLIGRGEVSIDLSRGDDHRIPIATLTAGEVFGEMAAIEKQPRLATAIAKGDCVLLEISEGGLAFIRDAHPEVGFELMAKLSARLRHVTEKILVNRLNDLNQKFELLKREVDGELNVAKASIGAAERTLEVTNQRASEVLETTSRNHDRIFQAFKVLAIVGSLVAVALGAFGYYTIRDIESARETAQSSAAEAAADLDKISAHLDTSIDMVERVNQRVGEIEWYRDFFVPRFYLEHVIKSTFRHQIIKEPERAKETFIELLEYPDDILVDRVFSAAIIPALTADSVREKIKQFLVDNIDLTYDMKHKYRFLYCYALLVAYDIDDDPSHLVERVEAVLGDHRRSYRGPSIKTGQYEGEIGPAIFEKYFEEAQRQALFRRALQEKSGGEIPKDEVMKMYDDPSVADYARGRVERIAHVWAELIP